MVYHKEIQLGKILNYSKHEIIFFNSFIFFPSIQVANDEADVKLTKPAAQRADTGIYELKLKNSEGEDVLPVKITVVDKPAACQGPLEAIEATKSTVTLQWKPPVDDGGSDVSGYVVEKCLDGSNNWEKCTGLFMQPKATIKNLEEGKAYKFRVKAENIYGEGEPLETKTSVVVKPPFGNFHTVISELE